MASRVASECSMAGESVGFRGVILMVDIWDKSIGIEAAEGIIFAAIAEV